MKKVVLSLLLSCAPVSLNAASFLDSIALFLLQCGFDKSIEHAETFLHSPAGNELIENFKNNGVKQLVKEDIQEIRRFLEGTSKIAVPNVYTSYTMQSILASLTDEQLKKSKEIITYLQLKLRTPEDWMRKDIVDDIANCMTSLINKELLIRTYGETPPAKDYLFGVLMSKYTMHDIKTKVMLKLCKWRLALKKDK